MPKSVDHEGGCVDIRGFFRRKGCWTYRRTAEMSGLRASRAEIVWSSSAQLRRMGLRRNWPAFPLRATSGHSIADQSADICRTVLRRPEGANGSRKPRRPMIVSGIARAWHQRGNIGFASLHRAYVLAHRSEFPEPNQSDSTRPVPSLKNIPLPVSPKSAP